MLRRALAALILAAAAHCAPAQARADAAGATIGPAQLAVIVNDADPASVVVGARYAARRGVPSANVIHVRFEPGRPVMQREAFIALHRSVEARLPPGIQAYALTWTAPYRVDCMSITTAFAAGFDPAWCASGCHATRRSPYFNTSGHRPFEQYGLRPAMIVAAGSVEGAIGLVERGYLADGTRPAGTGYLVQTTDKARSVRAALYAEVKRILGPFVRLRIMQTDLLADRHDVLFYFTGAVTVAGLQSIGFRPGAIADHLTSTGGRLTDSRQMSALRWIDAGATGTYGTVVEPCNLLEKFPHPGVVIGRYLSGDTLVEAYWKSVAMPGQGVFVGEPLAAPYRPRGGS
ncbi:MAG: TIGR03790 family protein [Gammaproteobacteria bacterium]